MILSKGGVALRALIEIDGTKARWMIPVDQNAPEQIRRFNEAPSDRRGMRWDVPFEYEGEQVELAYLKAAYVAAFARFGYRYLFGVQALRDVRAELANPQGNLSGFVGRWSDGPEPTLRFVVCPRPVPTLMVEIGTQTIALPWFGSSETYYSTLGAVMKEANGPSQFEYSRITGWPEGLMLSEDFDQEPLPAEAWALTAADS